MGMRVIYSTSKCFDPARDEKSLARGPHPRKALARNTPTQPTSAATEKLNPEMLGSSECLVSIDCTTGGQSAIRRQTLLCSAVFEAARPPSTS